MCETCFQKEIRRFETEEEYNDVMFQIRSRASIKFVCRKPDTFSVPKYYLFGFLGIGKQGEDSKGYDLFKCVACNQYWEINAPDHSWRGFLRRGSKVSIEGCREGS